MPTVNRQVFLSKSTCDVVKLIAALLVLTSHVSSFALSSHYNSTNPIFYAMASQNGYLGVAIFFFLSGYGLMKSELKNHLGGAAFFRRRILKVYLPVLLVTALWLPLQRQLPPPVSGLNSCSYELLYGFADAAMWFVRVLIPLYVVFYLAITLSRLISVKTATYLFLVGTVLFAIIYCLLTDSIQKHSVPMFALGALAATNNPGSLKKLSLLTISVGALVSMSTFATPNPATGFVHCFFDYIIVILLVVFLSARKVQLKCPALLGAISFDIYLTHFKVLEITAQTFSLPQFLIGSIIITAVLSLAFYQFRTFVLTRIPNYIYKSFTWKK